MLNFLESIALAIFTTITSIVMIFTGASEIHVVNNTPQTPKEVIVKEVEEKNTEDTQSDDTETDDAQEVAPKKDLLNGEDKEKKEVSTQSKTETEDIDATIREDLEKQLQDIEDELKSLIEASNNIANTENNFPPLQSISDRIRKSVVNIFCISSTNGLKSITGSGVVVHPGGVILTNAHIAQYFLLDDYVDCTIRTGSPAQNMYTAELLYISPSWIADNYFKLTQESPRGTGEHDFAFLNITGRTNPEASLPSSFVYLPIEIGEKVPKINESVFIVAYPAGFLGSTIIQSGLNTLSTVGTVSDIFTFEKNTLDLFSIFGSILAQKGASGGAVANEGGNLIGIVVTATEEENTGERELRAITASHINRSLSSDFNISLSALLSSSIKEKADQFQSLIAPSLRSLLLENL